MRQKKLVITLICAIMPVVLAISAFGQAEDANAVDKRITIQMTEKPLYTVFMRLINKYDVAIGFEESSLDREHRHYCFETNVPTTELKSEYNSDREFLPPVQRFSEHLITVDFRDAKLADVMNSIVKQMKNYDWEFADGVINIFPIRGRDSRLEKLLNSHVREFVVGQGADVGSIQAQLMLFLPEFKAFLSDTKLEADTTRSGSSFVDRKLPEGMRFSNLTFKSLLNAITRAKRGGWILDIKARENEPGKEFVEIFI